MNAVHLLAPALASLSDAARQSFELFARLSPVERLGWVLVHSLWQHALLALLLAVALWVLRGTSARVRYAAACAAMVVAAALPVVTYAVAARVSRPVVDRAEMRPLGGRLVRIGPAFMPAESAASSAAASGNAADDGARRGRWPLALKGLSLAWVIGAGLISAWHLLGWTRAQRLRRRTAPPPGEWQQTVHALVRRIGVRGPVRLGVSSGVTCPAVVGLLRPVILVPASVLTGLSPEHLEALFLHELAHVRRYDYLVNLLQLAVETALFYHPTVWWIGRCVRREREHCCDDLAAAACGSAHVYAAALAAMERLRQGGSESTYRALAPALALSADGGSLLRRVERLLHVPAADRRWRRPSPVPLAVVLVAAAGVLLASGSGPIRAEPPATVPATSPARAGAGEKADPAAKGEPVKPEDLDAGQPSDYRISRSDLVQITVGELTGPGKETIKTTRVAESGGVTMPFLKDPVRVAGLTEAEAEKAIAKAYKEQNVLQNAPVSVTVIEARGRSFAILGAAAKPGQYAVSGQDMRLLDAIAQAGGTNGKVQAVKVIRRADGQKPGRTIEVPAEPLLAGDKDVNVIIRPGDTVLLVPPPAPAAAAEYFVGGRVTHSGAYSLDKADVTVRQAVASAGAVEPEKEAYVLVTRRGTDGSMVRVVDGVPLRDVLDEKNAAPSAATRLQAGDTIMVLSNKPEKAPAAANAKEGPGAGDFYVGGHVDHPGAYSFAGKWKKVTATQALILAGYDVDRPGEDRITVIRRIGKDADSYPLLKVPAAALLAGTITDPELQPEDQVMVGPPTRAPSTAPGKDGDETPKGR